MKFTRYLHGLFLLMTCLSVSQVYGQTQLEKALTENQKLSDKVQKLTATCDSLADQVQIKRNELASLQRKIDSNDSIINESKSGAPLNKLKALQKQVDSLNGEVEEMRETNQKLNEQKVKLEARIKAAESELGDMGEFQAIKARNEIEQKYEQNKFLLTQGFTQLSEENLNAIINSVNEFNGMKGFDEYKKRVDAVKKNKDLYNKGMLILSRKYVEKDIQEVYFKVKDLLENKKSLQFISDEQNNELVFIRKYLSRYAGGVKALKGIINAVNNDKGVISFRAANDSSKQRNCRDAINKVIDSYVYTNDDGKKYNLQEIKERYFTDIPYLDEAFKQYLDQLKKSPLQTTQIEGEILSIKVK